ncbi:MAG: hypothetical protein ACLFTT_06560 [Candidatus Hydrogenedentota bacterium]
MPCRDVTELIRVIVDDAGRFVEYRFIKRTCGQGVGVDTLLMDLLAGQPIADILDIDPNEFIVRYPVAEPIEEFLTLKHLIAVQSALEVLTGQAAGGPDAVCAAAKVSFEDGQTTLDARITVDLVTERIKACGNCRNCGNAQQDKKRIAFT